MNIKRATVPILCLLLLLLSFIGVVHGTFTILDEQINISSMAGYATRSFDLPAGDNITIYIQVDPGDDPIDFGIGNGTHTLYERQNILSLDDVWTVPAEGNYDFIFSLTGESSSGVHVILGSEIIPEFPTWTSMLLILFTLTIAIVIYKRRLLKTPIH